MSKSKEKTKVKLERGREMLKEKKGITLVALVITIIIIIILATVAINFAFGNNGLITRAEQAKDFYANDTTYTGQSITNVESYIDSILPGEGGGEITQPDIPGGEEAETQGAITFKNLEWTGGKASVKVSTNTSYTIQYQVVANEGTSVETKWKTAPDDGVIGDLNHRDVVYARLTDGTNYGEEASRTIKDTTPPTISNITTSNITENSITVTVTATDNESGIASYTYTINGGSQATNSTGSYQFTGLNAGTEYTIQVTVTDRAGQTASDSTQATTEVAEISESTSYVGYYADIDGNGSVDGIIYADLAIGGSGQWYNSDGTYTIPKGSNFKKYEVSQKNQSNDFGTKDVIKVTNASGNDRFYVMALDDFNPGTYYCWYDAAYGNMSDYATATSLDFGKGKENTAAMIEKWNNSSYGAQNDNGTYLDMWGAIQGEVAKGCFVPSRGEWSAFASNLGITSSNYKNQYSLSDRYWSSSQNLKRTAWNARFDNGYMIDRDVYRSHSVRLSATF